MARLYIKTATDFEIRTNVLQTQAREPARTKLQAAYHDATVATIRFIRGFLGTGANVRVHHQETRRHLEASPAGGILGARGNICRRLVVSTTEWRSP